VCANGSINHHYSTEPPSGTRQYLFISFVYSHVRRVLYRNDSEMHAVNIFTHAVVIAITCWIGNDILRNRCHSYVVDLINQLRCIAVTAAISKLYGVTQQRLRSIEHNDATVDNKTFHSEKRQCDTLLMPAVIIFFFNTAAELEKI